MALAVWLGARVSASVSGSGALDEVLLRFSQGLDALGIGLKWRLATVSMVVALVLLYLIPPLSRAVLRWLGREWWTICDFMLLFLLLSAWPAARWEVGTPAVLVVAATSTALLTLRVIAQLRRAPQQQELGESHFDRVMGQGGFAPLRDYNADELGRSELLKALVDLIRAPRTVSLSFGLDGAWGSGKTSLLRGLEHRLQEAGIPVVWFGAWDYREPERLVTAYFLRIREALADRVDSGTVAPVLRRLASGLVSLSTKRYGEALQRMIGNDLQQSTVEGLRANLREVLLELELPVVVLVDDLDRLDGDELRAVLRAFRLVSELPHLTHVVAYDREQIAKTLYPDDPRGTRARDYLGKIVNVEFTVGSPPENLSLSFLERSLAPLLELAGQEDAQRFKERMTGSAQHAILAALTTPREIRRVAAATAWIWQRMSRHLNLFDLFVLELLHYRDPANYSTMRTHPDWFTYPQWSLDLWRRMFAEDYFDEERKAFFTALRSESHGSREAVVSLRLFEALLPVPIRGGGSVDDMPSDSEVARQERRIYHPDIFPRYFHLHIPVGTVSEADIEDFFNDLEQTPAGPDRQELVRRRWLREIEDGRLASFTLQWDRRFGWLDNPRKLKGDLVLDLMLGTAACSDALIREITSTAGTMGAPSAPKLAYLASILPKEDATESLCQVFDVVQDFGVLGYLLSWARGSQEEGAILECKQLQLRFDERVQHTFAAGERKLLAEPFEARRGIFHLTSQKEEVAKLIEDELKDDPRLLPRLLELYFGISHSAQGQEIGQGDIGAISGRFDPAAIDQVTRQVRLSAWTERRDRELVERFRRWLSER